MLNKPSKLDGRLVELKLNKPKLALIVKRALLLAGSSLVTLLVIVLVLIQTCRKMGIVDPAFRHENEVGMWLHDPETGFRNMPHFKGYCAGTVTLRTNLRGFRGTTETQPEPQPNTHRLIGMGDSVTWGIGVNETETFLARLGQSLKGPGQVEVLNAGVVGYSTWQEAVQFTTQILPLRPEVVFVNYCENDLIPTEDPFDLTQGLYLKYLQQQADEAATESERGLARDVAALVRAPRFKRAYDSASRELQDAAWELLVERPMRQMASAARENKVRLVYVFIPMVVDSKDWARRTATWQQVLTEEGAEWIDLTEMIHSRNPRMPEQKQRGRFDVRVPFLDAILRQRKMEAWQDSELYLDIMHPTRRGHTLIAAELQKFLQGEALSSGVKFHRIDTATRSSGRPMTMRPLANPGDT